VRIEYFCSQSATYSPATLAFPLITLRTFAQASLGLFLVSTFRSHLELLRVMMVRMREATAQASLVRPATHQTVLASQ